MGTIAELSHISVAYGNRIALDQLSLSVRCGEHLCVIGANGSGKSTLALVLAGLLAPDAGSIQLSGMQVIGDGGVDYESYRKARQSLGIVFQNPDDQLVTNVVEEEVAFGPENLCVDPKHLEERIVRELKRVALQGRRYADPYRLSNGQKQRVAIAGALAMDSSLLVLDEPASLLDFRGRTALLRVIRRLSEAGMSIVHVTHFMEDALAADRVIVLEHGRIAAEGAPRELFEGYRDRLDLLGLEAPFAARLSTRLIDADCALAWTADEDELASELCKGLRGQDRSPAGVDEPNSCATMMLPGAPKPASDMSAAAPAAEASAAASAAVNPATPKSAAAPAISVRDLSFAFGKHVCTLDTISFEIAHGEHCAIIGQTGSGKSTLLKCLAGLIFPDAGIVNIEGFCLTEQRKRVRKKNLKLARRHLGYVMQRPERQLFAQSVWEDVAFGPTNLGLSADEIESRTARALELCGLDGRSDDSPFSLSGGMRRLCAIAGILAMEPEILLLDEPASGLDPKARGRLQALLAHLKDEGVTILEITHSMEDAALADKVLVLDAGQLLLQGSPGQVFTPQNATFLQERGLGLPRTLAFAQKLAEQGVQLAQDHSETHSETLLPKAPLLSEELLAASLITKLKEAI